STVADSSGPNHTHDISSSCDRSDRCSSSQGLREARQIRLHAIELLSATRSETEPGQNLIEDEKNIVLVSDLSNGFEIVFVRQNHPGTSENWFHDNCREVRCVPLDDFLQGGYVVPFCDDNGLRYLFWDSGIERKLRG